MSLTVEEIEAAFHTLGKVDRNRLLRTLIADIDGKEEQNVDALWLQEAERRHNELRSDAVKGIPIDETLRKARYKLNSGH